MNDYAFFCKYTSQNLRKYWDLIDGCMSRDKSLFKDFLKRHKIHKRASTVLNSDTLSLVVAGCILLEQPPLRSCLWDIIKNTYFYFNLDGFERKIYILATEILAYSDKISSDDYSVIGARYRDTYSDTLKEMISTDMLKGLCTSYQNPDLTDQIIDEYCCNINKYIIKE